MSNEINMREILTLTNVGSNVTGTLGLIAGVHGNESGSMLTSGIFLRNA
jgi:succinylglutamate desuccinylase